VHFSHGGSGQRQLSAGGGKAATLTVHWKGKVTGPAATSNSEQRFDEKHRDLCRTQGLLSLLSAPAVAGVAKADFTHSLSWLYSLPDKRGRRLATACHPLCGKVQSCPHG